MGRLGRLISGGLALCCMSDTCSTADQFFSDEPRQENCKGSVPALKIFSLS